MKMGNEVENIINEIIDKRVKKILKEKGFETPYEGKVLSVQQDNANTNPYLQYAEVDIVGYNIKVCLKNLSGELLYAGDRVRVYTNNSNLSNGYIGIKCN